MVWRAWGQGEALVMLHGGHGSWNHWIRNIDALSRHRTVWAPDMPGFGDSDKAVGCKDADTIWRPVADALAAVVGPGADLMGFSFGAMVSGYVAANRPELVRRLILVGAPAFGLRTEPVPGLVSVRGISESAGIASAHRANLMAIMLHSPDALDELALYMQTLNVPRDRLPTRRLSRTHVMLEMSPRWACPVMGIWGREDALYQGGVIAQLRATLAACDLRAFHLVDDVGHWVQYERAHMFNELLLGFLEDASTLASR